MSFKEREMKYPIRKKSDFISMYIFLISEKPTTTGRWRNIKNEILDIAGMGVSLMVAQLFINFMSTIVLIFAGQLGTAELDGTGLALSLANMTCWSITCGMATGSETLFAQAYGGPNRKKVGIFLQRSLVFFSLASIIMNTININGDILFTVLGQDPVLACIARRYLVIAAPGFISFFFFRLLISYLRVQDIFWPIVIGPAIGLSCCAVM